ncbi:hypothetical protein ACLKA6_016282 [Drosophila palustris]
MGVQWISYRRKSELQGILKEFGLDTEGTVEEMRSRLSSYASQPELPKAVGQRLAELEMTLGCTPTPDPKIRPRSPSPFPGEKQPGAGPSGATTSAEATGSTASPALPSSDVRLQVPPQLQMPGGTSEARTHDAFTEGAGPHTEEPTGAPSAPSRVKPRQPKAVSRPPPDDVSPSRDYLGGIAEPVVPAPAAKEPPDVPEETWVKQFLQEELSKFEGLTGVSHIAQHVITLRDNRPIKQRYYPKNPAMQKIINDQVDELLKDDRIEPSRSPHSAPIVLVGKKTGDVRMCVDYRQLNARSVPDAYPLPRINHILEKLRNAKYISTLDLKSGYWQIPMAEGSREYTAFTVPGRGLYHWKVMPFGLHSAPATFQRALDGIIVIGSSMKEHAANLREVLRRLREANLRLNKDKCSFFQKSLEYLGHVVSEAGIHTDPEKINAIKELAPPTNVKELRRCLGIASWYRRKWVELVPLRKATTAQLERSFRERILARFGMPSRSRHQRSTRSPSRRPPRSPPNRSPRSPRSRRPRARTQQAADPRQPRSARGTRSDHQGPRASTGTVAHPPRGALREVANSPPPRGHHQGQRTPAEPVANPQPPQRCPGTPQPSEMSMPNDVMLTPTRPSSASPTYEEACGLLSRRVLAPQDRPPGRLLGRRRREPGTQSDSNEDEAEPSPPPRSWLTPELDMGPSNSAEAQRRREAVQGRSGPAGLAAPHTTSPPVGTMEIDPTPTAWVRAPAGWVVHTPERMLPPDLVERLAARVAQGRRRHVRYRETADGKFFQIRINASERITVSLQSPEERGGRILVTVSPDAQQEHLGHGFTGRVIGKLWSRFHPGSRLTFGCIGIIYQYWHRRRSSIKLQALIKELSVTEDGNNLEGRLVNSQVNERPSQ